MTLTLSGSLLGRHSGRFLFQRGSGVFTVSDQAHRLFAHIDQHRPSSERFSDLCADFDLDAQAVTDSQVILDVSATPLDEHVFRVVGTGSVTASGRGVVAAGGSAVALPPAMIALWAIASRKPNLAEAVSTTAEIAGCRREEVSEQFASVAEKMVAARVLDIGLGTRPARAN